MIGPMGLTTQPRGLLTNDVETQRAQADMDVSEVKTMSAQGDIAAPPFAVETQIVVDSNGARAMGTLRNNSEVALQDAVLLGPGRSS